MRRAVFLPLVVLTACSGGGVGEIGSTTRTFDGPFDAVDAEVETGRIEVEVGTEADAVTVEFLPNGSDDWVATEGDTLTLISVCLGDDVVGCGGGFILTVPAGVDVTAKTDTGDVNLNGALEGTLSAQTASGSINAQALGAADLTVLTGTGAVGIAFDDTPAAVDLDSGSSPIAVSVPAGGYALDLDTTGAVDVGDGIDDDPSGPQLRAHSGTGDVQVVAN